MVMNQPIKAVVNAWWRCRATMEELEATGSRLYLLKFQVGGVLGQGWLQL